MKTSRLKLIVLFAVIITSTFFLSACGKKAQTDKEKQPVKTVAKALELKAEEKPIISLIPRVDGHELKLKIENIPSSIEDIEYELIYTAQDGDLEMEKGVGDTVKVTGKSVERDLLLGTASCTNGCKYKYDTGITGGTLTITLSTNDNQSATFEAPFAFRSAAEIKKEGGISLVSENLTISATPTAKEEYFVLVKNFGLPKNTQASAVYSVFSSGNGAGKVSSVTPSTVTKPASNTLTGNYLSP